MARSGASQLDRDTGDGHRDEPDRRRDEHDEPDAHEEAARQSLPGLARLGGEVRHGLETRVGERREREREGEVPPRRRGAQVDVREVARGEDEGEAEDDEQEVGEERQRGDPNGDGVQLRAPDEPDRAPPRG